MQLVMSHSLLKKDYPPNVITSYLYIEFFMVQTTEGDDTNQNDTMFKSDRHVSSKKVK